MGVANIASYSLLGVLVISLTAGSILSLTAIPVPYWLLVFTLPSTLTPQWGILAPVAVGLASALGSMFLYPCYDFVVEAVCEFGEYSVRKTPASVTEHEGG